ncbi:hypothetical protein TNCV_2142911 [Trichonephila clavipes]|nr:hypothetical protein TNCV_2142911 [Trichonephila clavipes]
MTSHNRLGDFLRWRAACRRTSAPQLARDLAAVSERRISRQTLYIRLAKTVLYARRPVLCAPLTTSNRKDRLLLS